MNIRYVAKDVEWTDSMRDAVWTKIVEPLRQGLKTDRFDLSVHFHTTRKRVQNRKPEFEMWAVLVTYGRGNEVVRCAGPDFYPLVTEISTLLRARVRKAGSIRRRLFVNPFRHLAHELSG
jgi:hypothetical protein